jgi:predicted secreted acid phosphatase
MKFDVIVDLDGTLSNSEHRQHYMQGEKKNWPAFYSELVNDPPNFDILHLIKLLHKDGAEIIYCSGRPEEYRELTLAWLKKFGAPTNDAYPELPEYPLYMRKDKDYRADYIVKLELLKQMKADGYNPNFAFDDRDQVVKAWRSVGIRTLQVADGNF